MRRDAVDWVFGDMGCVTDPKVRGNGRKASGELAPRPRFEPANGRSRCAPFDHRRAATVEPIDGVDVGPIRRRSGSAAIAMPGPRPLSWRWPLIGLFLLIAGVSGFLGLRTSPEVPQPLQATSASVPPGTVEVDGVRYRTIETYDVCDRVLGENPLVTDEERAAFGPEPDPATWKLLELRCPKVDGGWALCRTVRGPEWLEEQRPEVGGQVYISVPECGIEGDAEVLSIGPCPPVRPGEGRVVTSTFRHEVAGLVEVHVEGLEKPIGCTGNHPFWSEDRQDFVRADALREGETLATLDGTARVTSVTTRPGPQAVYNLEVQGEHVYRVSEGGILVHNGMLRGWGCDFKFLPKAINGIPILGRYRLVKGVAEIRIPILGRMKSGFRLRSLLNTLETEARAAGAREVRIVGEAIDNPALRSPAARRIFERLGYTFQEIDANTIRLSKVL